MSPRATDYKVSHRDGDIVDESSLENRSVTEDSMEDKPETKDDYLRRRRKKFYFQADTKSLSYETYRMEELIETEIMFNYKYYLEFLFYHLLFYMFLGKLKPKRKIRGNFSFFYISIRSFCSSNHLVLRG